MTHVSAPGAGVAAMAVAVALGASGCATRLDQAGLPPAAPVAAATEAADVPGWALVEGDGTLVQGPNATRARRIARGAYEVGFDSRLRACGFTVTLRANLAATAFAMPRRGDDHAVFVGVVDAHGRGVDGPFNLVVTC